MTSNAQVSVEIIAHDRASPVLSRVGRNMGLLQRSAGTVASQMTGLGGAAGVAARSIGMLGLGLGPVGLAFTALGIGAGLAAKRIGEMQKTAATTRTATNSLRTSLILSGFSANNANAAVQELKTSFNAIAFQAIPRLTWEMQGFLASLDKDSQGRIAAMAKQLTEMFPHLTMEEALTIIGDAFQNNFDGINALLRTSITNSAEFAAAWDDVRLRILQGENPIVDAFLKVARATGPEGAAKAMEEFRKALLAADPEQRKQFQENLPFLAKGLGVLDEATLKVIADSLEGWPAVGGILAAQTNQIIGDLFLQIAAYRALEQAARAAREAMTGSGGGSGGSGGQVGPVGGGDGVFGPGGRIQAPPPPPGGGVPGIGIGGKPGIIALAHGGIVPGPLGAPMPAIVHGGETVIPGGGGALTIVNQIGDQVLDTLVVDVLNRNVRRVDPSLGLG